jgi:hypothetical protein
MSDWVQHFRQSASETLKSHILVLQAKIIKSTGIDPLDAFYLNPKVEFRNTGGGLSLDDVVVDFRPPPEKPKVRGVQHRVSKGVVSWLDATPAGSHPCG